MRGRDEPQAAGTPKPTHPISSAATLLALLFLPSCFTLTLWGFEPSDDRDPVTGQVEASWQYDDETEWSWGLFGLRVLGTPLALALDCVTMPVQAVLFCDDDDC